MVTIIPSQMESLIQVLVYGLTVSWGIDKVPRASGRPSASGTDRLDSTLFTLAFDNDASTRANPPVPPFVKGGRRGDLLAKGGNGGVAWLAA